MRCLEVCGCIYLHESLSLIVGLLGHLGIALQVFYDLKNA
jgi:hypothetical protein